MTHPTTFAVPHDTALSFREDERGRSVHLGGGNVVYEESPSEDWLLVTLGVGVCSSMSVVLMMLFSGYGAV